MNLIEFLKESVNEYYASKNICEILENKGFTKLQMGDNWTLKNGGCYYIQKDETSVIAFKIGSKCDDNASFNIAASHIDSPCLKIKPNGIIANSVYSKLNTEVYGGPILYSWFDRPLGIAGRIMVKKDNKIESILVKSSTPIAIIPSAAIHLKNDVTTNPQKDMLALVSLNNETDINTIIHKLFKINKEDILSFDLGLYNMDEPTYVGLNKEFLVSPRIDNLECAYSTLDAFINSENENKINVYVAFHNEEVGSSTKQGANSTFLKDVLLKISKNELLLINKLANSFIVSADNAHGAHPNYPELADPTNMVYLNKGVVIKHNSQTRYTTDCLSEAVIKAIGEQANVNLQHYTNKSDQRGGSTLGAISLSHISIPSCDIGLAQLAMHSALETAGANDYQDMILLIKKFYESKLQFNENNFTI